MFESANNNIKGAFGKVIMGDTIKSIDEHKEIIQKVFDAYIKKIIRRTAKREVNRQVRKNMHEQSLYDGDIAVEVNFDLKINDDGIERILGALKEIDKNVIILNICEDIPLKYVAEILDINYQTVRTKKMRALVKLKKRGEKDGICRI